MITRDAVTGEPRWVGGNGTLVCILILIVFSPHASGQGVIDDVLKGGSKGLAKHFPLWDQTLKEIDSHPDLKNISDFLAGFDPCDQPFCPEKKEVLDAERKEGWNVIEGKEFDYAEYAKMGGAIGASVASCQPGPFFAYCADFLSRSITVMTDALLKEALTLPGKITEDLLFELIQTGKIDTIEGIDFAGKLLTCGHPSSYKCPNGHPLPAGPNTFLPIIKYRIRRSSGGGNVGPGGSRSGGIISTQCEGQYVRLKTPHGTYVTSRRARSGSILCDKENAIDLCMSIRERDNRAIFLTPYGYLCGFPKDDSVKLWEGSATDGTQLWITDAGRGWVHLRAMGLPGQPYVSTSSSGVMRLVYELESWAKFQIEGWTPTFANDIEPPPPPPPPDSKGNGTRDVIVGNAGGGGYIGVNVLSDGNGIILQSVTHGGPASASGLKVGDLITEVDGMSTQGMNHFYFANYVRSKSPGSILKVRLGTSGPGHISPQGGSLSVVLQDLGGGNRLGAVLGRMPNGFWRVMSVFPGSPAATGGLASGMVITEINGQPSSFYGDAPSFVRSLAPGSVLNLRVQ